MPLLSLTMMRTPGGRVVPLDRVRGFLIMRFKETRWYVSCLYVSSGCVSRTGFGGSTLLA
jgi:hypothetical protein